MPAQKLARFSRDYQLSAYDTSILVSDTRVADYFEDVVQQGAAPKNAANWINGQLFSEMNASSLDWSAIPVTAANLADLISRVEKGELNLQTAKTVFGEMFITGRDPDRIITEKGLKQIHDNSAISNAIRSVLMENPKELESYLAGKETLSQWFFGQVMSKTRGQASPAVVKAELERRLNELKAAKSSD